MTYYVTYQNGNIINRPVVGTIEEIKAAMSAHFAELRNVTPVVDGTNVTFSIPTGGKN